MGLWGIDGRPKPRREQHKRRAVRGEWKSSAMGEEKVRRMWERAYLCSIHRGLRIHRIRLLVECVYLYSYVECMWARVGAERLPIPGVTRASGVGVVGAHLTWRETWRKGDGHVAFLSFFLPLPLTLLTYYDDALIHFPSVVSSAKWSRLFVVHIDFQHGGFALSLGSENRSPFMVGRWYGGSPRIETWFI